MTKFGLAAALLAIVGLLAFGYAREYVPTGHELILEGSLELDRIDQIAERLETQPGVKSIEMRLVGEDAQASRTLFGEIRYEGFTIWLESGATDTGQTLIASSYRRRLAGAHAPEVIEAALSDLHEVIAATAVTPESPLGVTRAREPARSEP